VSEFSRNVRRTEIKKKAPGSAGGLPALAFVNIGAMRNSSLGPPGCRGRQFHVSEISPLCAALPASLSDLFVTFFADSFSRSSPTVRMRSPFSEVITSPAFTPAFSAGERGVHIATEYPFAIGCAEKCSQLSADIFRINSQPRLPAAEEHVPVHSIDGISGISGHAKRGRTGRRRRHSSSWRAGALGFPERRANGLRTPIAPHGELDAAPAGVS